MENKAIASSQNALPVLGAFAGELDKAGTFDAGKEFLKGIFKVDPIVTGKQLLYFP